MAEGALKLRMQISQSEIYKKENSRINQAKTAVFYTAFPQRCSRSLSVYHYIAAKLRAACATMHFKRSRRGASVYRSPSDFRQAAVKTH